MIENFESPGNRYRHEEDSSGEEFREDYLLPALENHEKVIVDLTGIWGMSSGFMSEAFEALIDEHGFTYDELKDRLQIVPMDAKWSTSIETIHAYMQGAQQRKNQAAAPTPAYEQF